MDESGEKPSSRAAVRAAMGLLSRTGPEVPPDIADSTPSPVPPSNVGNEPTALLPVIRRPAPTAPRRVVARAVIVYEPEPRQSRILLVFTALLVALTVGVMLGQTVAYRPASRPVSTTPSGPAPSYGAPPEAFPSAPGQVLPAVGRPVTAPLGSTRTRLIEVTGASAFLRIRSADLGALLFSVTATDGATVPSVVDTTRGPLLGLDPAGAAADTGRTEVQLHSKVRWTIRLTGASTTQEIDMSAGGLAGIELVGGASRAVLRLPRPTGAVPLRVTGAVGELRIRAGDGGPVRLRLGKGADTATLAGTRHRNVASGTVLRSPGWRSATDRYDLSASARVGSVRVDHAP